MTRMTVAGLALLALAAPLAAQESGIAVGAKAPAVQLKTMDGQVVDLARYIGKQPVLLEFWATWCSNCEELLPRVKAAHAAFGKEVAFFGVNVTVNQTRERVKKYIEQHQPPYTTLWDDGGVSARAYDVPATSYVVIIDRAGKVAYTGLGGTQDLNSALKPVVSK